MFATFFSVGIGVLLGALAGFYRGTMDTIVARMTEMVMAFPILLFIIAISATLGQQLNSITFGFMAPGVFTLVLIFSLFGWFYPARIVRGQTFSLREKEFVEAAQMIGASDWRIVRSHLLPHLVGPDDRVLDADRREQHHRRGRALVPRPRHPGADRELGQPAGAGPGVLPRRSRG